VAAVFDMLDGVAARLINATSDYGAELDSLCDAVSFGVAPSFMLYKAYFHQMNELGILLAALPALAGVIRLARFNIQLESSEDKHYFKGLPIPSAALTIISYVIFFHEAGYFNPVLNSWFIISLTAIVSFAMISVIKYDNIPRPNARSFRERPVAFIYFSIAIIASAVSKGFLIFPFMMFFILAGAVRHYINWLRTEPEADDELSDV
jgi:CDP-diacylglycerol--serine O-phosphatidyltransferase